MTLRESALFSDWLSLVSRPYHWLLMWIYNILLRPLLDGVVRSHVVKTALGNNRPAAEVIAISAAPIDSFDVPCLPDWLSYKIAAAADRHTGDIAPKLRRLLAEPSFSTGLQSFGDTITGLELVHTSYFEQGEIQDLLAANIAWAVGQPQPLSMGSARSLALWGWFRKFKLCLGVHVLAPPTELAVVAFPSRDRVQPRRRHRAA